MKKIIIYHPCSYTRLGFVKLIGAFYPVFCTDNMKELFSFLEEGGKGINIMIISSIHTEFFLPKVQGELSLIISKNSTNFQVYLATERASLKQLCFAFNSIRDSLDAIDLGMPLPDLIAWFDRKSTEGERPVSAHCNEDTTHTLNYREQRVIYLFLMGLDAERIGSMLKLSNKTVSGYKRAGLRKLGARNFQELLLPPSIFASPLSLLLPPVHSFRV